MKIRIGHLSTFYHTAVLLMARKELTARVNADVEWKLLGTGPAILQAGRQEHIQADKVAGDEVVSAGREPEAATAQQSDPRDDSCGLGSGRGTEAARPRGRQEFLRSCPDPADE